MLYSRVTLQFGGGTIANGELWKWKWMGRGDRLWAFCVDFLQFQLHCLLVMVTGPEGIVGRTALWLVAAPEKACKIEKNRKDSPKSFG
jgi:hypothetical protein